MRIRKAKANTEPVYNLCSAVQPDGRGDRCIRFHNHEGLHQTFVAEWEEGSTRSRRRSPLRRLANHAFLQTQLPAPQQQRSTDRRIPVQRLRPTFSTAPAI